MVYAHWDEVNELIHSLSAIDHSGFSDQIVHFTPDEELYLKCRIQLPRQDLNSPWNEALDLAIDAMLPCADTFRKIGNNEVTI